MLRVPTVGTCLDTIGFQTPSHYSFPIFVLPRLLSTVVQDKEGGPKINEEVDAKSPTKSETRRNYEESCKGSNEVDLKEMQTETSCRKAKTPANSDSHARLRERGAESRETRETRETKMNSQQASTESNGKKSDKLKTQA